MYKLTTNGPVRDIYADTVGGQVYFGGDFSRAGHMPAYGAIIDAETGLANSNLPSINGEVYASAPDGAGGFYFGGEFTMIGDSARRNLAHVDASGNITNWGALTNPNQAVRVIYPDSDRIYIAGDFQAFDGWYHSSAALVDDIHAVPDRNFPKISGVVYDAIEDGEGGWYVAGSFSHAGDEIRSDIAHIRADGTLSDFMKDYWINGHVNRIDIHDGKLFAGGNFTSVRDSITAREAHERNGLVAFDLSTGKITEWAPSVDGTVRCLEVFDGKVYVGGLFSAIDDMAHQNIAEIDIETGSVSAWSPYAALEVVDIAVTDSVVFYDCAYFAPFTDMYAVDRESGEREYSHQISGPVTSVEISGNLLMVGTKYGFQVFDLISRSELEWDLEVTGPVYDCAVAGDTIFLGGRFDINGIPKSLVAVDATSGELLDWDLDVHDEVFCTVYDKNSGLLIGGKIKAVGGHGPRFIAALDSAEGELLDWDIAPNDQINAMASRGDKLYLGGQFTEIRGQEVNSLVAIHKTTGMIDGWVPVVKDGVYEMMLDGDRLYVHGRTYEDEGRRGIVCVDLNKNALTGFQAGFASGDFAIHGDYLYATQYSSDGAYTRFIVVVDKITGEPVARDTIGVESGSYWMPRINLVEVSDDMLYLGGEFDALNGVERFGLGAIDLATWELAHWNPHPVSDHFLVEVPTIHTLSVSGSNIFVGGDFVNIGGMVREGIAAIDLATGQLTGFAPSIDGPVECMKLHDGVLYFSGIFDTVNGQIRKRLAAVDASTGQLTEWKPEITGGLYDMEIWGQSMMVGGDFRAINGVARKNLAELDLQTGVLLPWAPEADGRVQDVEVIGNNVFIAGYFNSVGGRDQKHLASLSALSGEVNDWWPSLDYTVHKIAVAGDRLLIISDSVRSVHRGTGDVSAWGSNSFRHYEIKISGDYVYLAGERSWDLLEILEKGTGHTVIGASGAGYGVSSLDVSGNYVIAGGKFADDYPRQYGLTVFKADLPDIPDVVVPLSIDDAPGWSVYPNPANNYFSLDAPGPVSRVVLLSLDGRIIKEYLPGQHASYSLDGVEDGIYLVYIGRNGSLKHCSRLIVNRKNLEIHYK